MLVDKGLRKEAFGHFRSNRSMDLPTGDELPTDPVEIECLLEEIKPFQYAALARIMNSVLDLAFTTNLATYQTKTLPDNYYQLLSPIGKLRADALDVFKNAIDELRNTTDFQQAARYTHIIGSLDNRRFINLREQLQAGADTAVTSMNAFLQEMPAIIQCHAPEIALSGSDLARIARRSISLPWTMAMMSINQMMATRYISGGVLSFGHDRHQESINPDIFEVKIQNGSVLSVGFAGIENAVVPKGYTPYEDIVPLLEEDTSIKDIQPSRADTIGCPITLLAGKMNKLWQWQIDGAETRGLLDR